MLRLPPLSPLGIQLAGDACLSKNFRRSQEDKEESEISCFANNPHIYLRRCYGAHLAPLVPVFCQLGGAKNIQMTSFLVILCNLCLFVQNNAVILHTKNRANACKHTTTAWRDCVILGRTSSRTVREAFVVALRARLYI